MDQVSHRHSLPIHAFVVRRAITAPTLSLIAGARPAAALSAGATIPRIGDREGTNSQFKRSCLESCLQQGGLQDSESGNLFGEGERSRVAAASGYVVFAATENGPVSPHTPIQHTHYYCGRSSGRLTDDRAYRYPHTPDGHLPDKCGMSSRTRKAQSQRPGSPKAGEPQAGPGGAKR